MSGSTDGAAGEEGADVGDGATGDRPDAGGDPAADPAVPEWDDEYVDRVADRLRASFDLEKDRTVAGERFTLVGTMEITSQKHFFHPALAYGKHHATEHLFVARRDAVAVGDLERYAATGHDLAAEWVEPDERHFSTDFTFAVIAPTVPEAVRSHVTGFRDRTLLKYGYNGHYEVNLVVAAPDEEAVVASPSTDVARAFALWEDEGDGDAGESPGLLARLLP